MLINLGCKETDLVTVTAKMEITQQDIKLFNKYCKNTIFGDCVISKKNKHSSGYYRVAESTSVINLTIME